MAQAGDFIDNYRIIIKLPSHPMGELYLVEHTFREGPSMLLQIWTAVELISNEERQAFEQGTRTGIIQPGPQSFTVRDSGIDALHPYVVITYSASAERALQNKFALVEHAFQSLPNDSHARADAFLHTLFGYHKVHAGQFENIPGPSTPPQRLTRLPRNRWLRVALAAMLLALLGWGLYSLYTIVPATAATVTIRPVKKTLSEDYSVFVYSDTTPASLQLHSYKAEGHKISFTTQQLSKTVAASGKGHHNATPGTGTLVYTNVQLDEPRTLEAGSFSSLSGVKIDHDGGISISNGVNFQAHAHADKPGTGGNIRAYDINFPVEIVDSITRAHAGNAYVTNPKPFGGGTNAYDFRFVQQADIDAVTTTFSKQLTPAASTKLAQQIQPGEEQAGDAQCTPKISSNHKAKDQANNVTIKMSVTCSALVYNSQELHDAAIAAFKDGGTARFGSAYGVIGDMEVGTPKELTTPTLDLAQYSIPVKGIWSFQYTPQRQQALQRLIAGKSRNDALRILGGREEIQNVTIATSHFPGDALPATPTSITLSIIKIDGLQV